jgi:hypothetical protein
MQLPTKRLAELSARYFPNSHVSSMTGSVFTLLIHVENRKSDRPCPQILANTVRPDVPDVYELRLTDINDEQRFPCVHVTATPETLAFAFSLLAAAYSQYAERYSAIYS